MGGAVSAGVDNDDLVDNLLEADYIKTPSVERVFRAVDRGMYFTKDARETAYKDLAWKSGNIHLSAPCIYCEVMENLQLAPGLSFLNLGSGTGYLSTMAGLMLGSLGVNHGVEIHQDVVQYAKQKLEDFKKTSAAIDEYDFCEPKFVEGNCLKLSCGSYQYDRVYCGASCPQFYESYMKNLIKVGGILVVPLNDRLLKITRTSETTWEKKSVLPVAFANLILPQTSDIVTLPSSDPLSLMDACRTTIRSVLLAAVDSEHPELKNRSPQKSKHKKQRTLRRLFIPLFGETIVTDIEHRDNRSTDEDSDDHFTQRERRNSDPSGQDHHSRSQSDEPSSTSTDNSDDRSRCSEVFQVRRRNFPLRFTLLRSAAAAAAAAPDDGGVPTSNIQTSNAASSTTATTADDSSDNSMEVDEPERARKSTKWSSKKSKTRWTESSSYKERNKRKETDMDESEASSHSSRRVQRCARASKTPNESECHTSEESMDSSDGKQSLSSRKRNLAKREKVDSGIGDDINNWNIPSDFDSDLDFVPDSDSDDGDMLVYKSAERLTILHGRGRRNPRTTMRVKDNEKKPEEDDSLEQEMKQCENNNYTIYLRAKIQQLPLPPSIKSFINFHRDL